MDNRDKATVLAQLRDAYDKVEEIYDLLELAIEILEEANDDGEDENS